MTSYYIWEALQTQAFDVLLNTFFWVLLWTLMTIRLNKIEAKLDWDAE
jgi:hypothetical protein